MPFIYIPQEQRGKNLSAALRYGESIMSCLPQDYQVYSSTPETVERIRYTMNMMQADDYLLLIGDPILIGLTMAVAFEFHDVLKVLKWDGQTRTYVPITLDIASPMTLP